MYNSKIKGFDGCLSKMGRDAAIHAFLKLSGYDRKGLKKKPKINKKKKYDMDSLNNFKDNLIIVKTYHNTVKCINTKERKKTKKKVKTNKNKEEILQFHNFFHPQTEVEESKYMNNPTCTKYTPKYNLIFPKLLTGPEWKIISGRKEKKLEIDEKDFLITHESKNIQGEYKCLVNMNKTTQRGELFGSNDVRVLSVKKFDISQIRKSNILNEKKNNKTININKSENKSTIKKKMDEAIKNIKIEDNKENCNIELLIENNISKKSLSNEKINKKNNEEEKITKETEHAPIDTEKSETKKYNSINDNSKSISKNKSIKKGSSKIFLLKKKKTYNTSQNEEKNENNNNNDIIPKKINNTINFEKTISREKLYKLNNKERYLDIARTINYSLVSERPKTFTFYKTSKNLHTIKKFKGIEPNPNYDANKASNILIVHSMDKVPNFNLILPRPGKKDDPLPSFMQKLFNREANYLMTDKSLQLNDFANGKLGKVDSSFFPKQSFNNMVNIKIIAGKTFENDCFIDDINHKKDVIKSKMKFKHKSLGRLIKEGALKKFDNITFKTFYKPKKNVNIELNSFLYGLKE